MKVKRLVYNPDKKGVFRMSVVENPAIKSGISLFSEQKQSDLKGIFYAPAMIPNLKIQRYDEETKEPYVTYYDEDTVEKLAYNYLKQGGNLGTNLEHEDDNTDGVYPIESWIVTNPDTDKTIALGMPKQVKGTWMLGFKCENSEVLEKIKEKLLNGLSIEGQVDYVEEKEDPISQFKNQIMSKNPLEIARNLLNVIMSAEAEEKKDEKTPEQIAEEEAKAKAEAEKMAEETKTEETKTKEEVKTLTPEEVAGLQKENETLKAENEALKETNANLEAEIAKEKNDATLMSEQIEKIGTAFEKYKTTTMSAQKLGDMQRKEAEATGNNPKHEAFLKETMKKIA